MSALATVTWKSFIGKFTTKLLSDRVFYVTIADADIHTLLDKYLDHMLLKFEQNGMVRTTQSFEFSF